MTTAQNTSNPLLKHFDTPYQTPPFDEIKPEHFVPAIEASIETARLNVEKIKSQNDAPNFENTIEALETASEDLGTVSGIYYALLSVIGGDAYQNLAEQIGPMTALFSSEVSMDQDLFARIKAVYDDRENHDYNDVEKTLLEDTYKGFVRSGALLSEEKQEKLKELNQKSSTLSPEFSNNLIQSSALYELRITDEKDLSGIPDTAVEGAKQAALDKGYDNEWLFTLDFPSYIPFITYADNRALREQIWKAFSNRAYGDKFDNTQTLQKIMKLRNEKMKLMGYDTYADFVLEERMAKTTQQVIDFLDKLKVAYKPGAQKDLEELKAFAQKTAGIVEIMPWDVGYFSEKRKVELFNFSEEELRPYFPLDKVLKGTFQHFSKLFNLAFTERADIQTWHKDVPAFEVSDKNTGEIFGVLYADFYVRKDKRSGAWMGTFRNHGLFKGETPPAVIEIVCNFPKPTKDRPSLLSFNDVETLFHELGHALHGLLGQTKYQSTSGTNVMWDFVELPSQLQENWLYEKETLDLVSEHYETGEKIPAQLIEKLCASKNYMSAWMGLRQTSLATLDMAFHSVQDPNLDDIIAFEDEAIKDCSFFPRYGGPSATSFAHIFAGGYAAGYYSYKWAEVLDADAFEAFKESGLYDQDTAQKYLSMILRRGGSADPAILYRDFRGRDADPDALFRREGLLKKVA